MEFCVQIIHKHCVQLFSDTNECENAKNRNTRLIHSSTIVNYKTALGIPQKVAPVESYRE